MTERTETAATATAHAVLQRLPAETAGDDGLIQSVPRNPAGRIIAQKAACPLQSALGLPQRQRFGWHVTGPHSPWLADDLSAMSVDADRVIAEARTIALSPEASAKAAALRGLIDSPLRRSAGLDTASWLEVLASADYIATWRGIATDDPGLADAVLRSAPHFSPGHAAAAIQALRRVAQAQVARPEAAAGHAPSSRRRTTWPDPDTT